MSLLFCSIDEVVFLTDVSNQLSSLCIMHVCGIGYIMLLFDYSELMPSYLIVLAHIRAGRRLSDLLFMLPSMPLFIVFFAKEFCLRGFIACVFVWCSYSFKLQYDFQSLSICVMRIFNESKTFNIHRNTLLRNPTLSPNFFSKLQVVGVLFGLSFHRFLFPRTEICFSLFYLFCVTYFEPPFYRNSFFFINVVAEVSQYLRNC